MTRKIDKVNQSASHNTAAEEGAVKAEGATLGKRIVKVGPKSGLGCSVSSVSAQTCAVRERCVSLPGVSTITKSAAASTGSSAASKRAFSSASVAVRSGRVESGTYLRSTF